MTTQSDSDDRYRILVEQASDGIAIYDKEGKLQEVNGRACELIGYTRDELLTLNVSDVIAPQNLAETPLRYEELQSGKSVLGERILLRKDSTTIPVELSARMLSDGRFQVIIRDITQRKMMEAEVLRLNSELEQRVAERTAQLRHANRELRAEIAGRKRLEAQVLAQAEKITEQYERLAHIIDEMPVGVLIAEGDPKTRSVTWSLVNRAAREQFGRNVGLDGQLSAPSYASFWPDGTPIPEHQAPLQSTLWEGEAARPREVLLRFETGDERTFLLSSALLYEDGGRREAIVVAQDITERKRVEEERIQLLESEKASRQQAELAVQVRDELLAIVSHDLKNPLAAIKGNSQLIRRRITVAGGTDMEKALAPVSRIDEAAGRMSVLINDLLDFGRLQAGQSLTLQRRPVDLVSLVRKVAAEFQQTAEHHHIEVVTHLPRQIGFWDSMRLEQVLGNLLSNAIKYSPGGGEITIDIAREIERADRAWAVIDVCDHGIGIAAEDLPHVFEWFRRAKNASGRISGAGIGLASANYIVSQHGGTINVQSEPGKGSAFTVKLPLTRSEK